MKGIPKTTFLESTLTGFVSHIADPQPMETPAAYTGSRIDLNFEYVAILVSNGLRSIREGAYHQAPLENVLYG